MRQSVIEGGCFALMVGVGDLYIVANGVRLGAGTLAIGLLVALPLSMGAVGPWLALRVMHAGRSRRRVAVTGAIGQVIAYAAMAACEVAHVLTPSLLIALAVVHQIFGQATGVAWASWFGELVPAELRGRYFSRRNRVVHSATFLGAIGGGTALQFLEPGPAGAAAALHQGGNGFVLLCALAAAARLLSALLLATTHEPEPMPLDGPKTPIRQVFRDSLTARRVLVVTFAMMISVWIAAPYFAAFMLEDLHFSYVEYTIANVSMVLATVLVLPLWGTTIDRRGPRGPYIAAIVAIALVPIPWFFAGGLAWVVPAQLLSGMAWGGHELAQFTSLLGAAPPRDRARVFATVTATSGVAQLMGTLIGGVLIGVGGFRLLLYVSVGTRLAVAIVASAALPAITARGHVLLRLVGARWAGGLRHRPVGDDGPHIVESPLASNEHQDAQGRPDASR